MMISFLVLQVLIIIHFFAVSSVYGVFEQSCTLLMPLEQIKHELFLIVGDAGVDVNTWKNRFERFEHHIRILRDKEHAELNRVRNGFKETSDNDLLTFLGIKPVSASFVGNLGELIKKHKLQYFFYQKDSSNTDIVSLPTIPFSVYFKSYENVFRSQGEEDAINFYKNFDTLSDDEQFEIIKKRRVEGSLGQSEMALRFGYQTGAWNGSSLANCENVLSVVKAFHLLWNHQGSLYDLVKIHTLNDQKKFLVGVGRMNTLRYNFISFWHGDSRKVFDNTIEDPFYTMKGLTFCLFPKNYRLIFHKVGVLLFNDNQINQTNQDITSVAKTVPRPSAYAKMLGFLYEYFFRSAFGDEHYLTLLYREIVAIPISLAPVLQKINDDGLITEVIVPPLLNTFQKFLKKTFGDTWNWDVTSKVLTFDDSKKDLTLKNFLMVAEQDNLLKIQFGRLQSALIKLKERLAVLNQTLLKLQAQFH